MDKTLERINAKIAKLQGQRNRIRSNRRVGEIEKIVKAMIEFSITPADIVAAFNAGEKTKKLPASALQRPRRAVQPKYRHPRTGDTWSGRGRAPRWLVGEENAGANRAQFRIGNPSKATDGGRDGHV